jgi:hypothetical protein
MLAEPPQLAFALLLAAPPMLAEPPQLASALLLVEQRLLLLPRPLLLLLLPLFARPPPGPNVAGHARSWPSMHYRHPGLPWKHGSGWLRM